MIETVANELIKKLLDFNGKGSAIIHDTVADNELKIISVDATEGDESDDSSEITIIVSEDCAIEMAVNELIKKLLDFNGNSSVIVYDKASDKELEIICLDEDSEEVLIIVES